MNEHMHISHAGVVTEVRICRQCDGLSYHTQDYPAPIQLREFQCAHGHLSFERLEPPTLGRTHDARRQAA
jgi:hypothetical protein